VSERRPRVLFVCVRNGGKSPMAAGLLAQAGEGSVEALSAGTAPATAVNALSAEVLAEVGVDIGDHRPRLVTEELLGSADRVITLGREVQFDPPPGVEVESWDTDEPSLRGIDGIERMRLVRDDIARRVEALVAELLPPSSVPHDR